MDISITDLSVQYQRAVKAWPFITDTEFAYHLPPRILFAVGSRETNLTDEIGDGGHGHGVFQLDDRSHSIPKPFPVNVQAMRAGAMLRSLLDRYKGDIRAALAAYNAGAGTVDYNLSHKLNVDSGTAHGNYSLDVYERMMYLQKTFPPKAVTTTGGNLNMDEATVRAIVSQEIAKFLHDPAGHQYSFSTLISEQVSPVARLVEDIDAKLTAFINRK